MREAHPRGVASAKPTQEQPMNNFVTVSKQDHDRSIDANRLPIVTPLHTFRRFRDDEVARPLLETELQSMIPRLQLREQSGVYFYVDDDECENWRDVYPAQRAIYQTWTDPIEAVIALVVRDVSGLSHQ
jgi:hypothetical protein